MKALVTGGAKGLGAEICYVLANEGHSLLIHYRESKREAEEVAQRCRSMGVEADTVPGDFRNPAGVEHFLKKIPEVNCLVNNVGIFLQKNALQTTPEEWQQLFQVNTQAPLQLMQGLVESLKKHQGTIVNLGIAGLTTLYPDTFCPAYTASKLSLYLLTKSFARELAPFQVTVNMISPGYLENSVTMPMELPMKRPVALSEVAQLVAYLVRPTSRSITGQNIEIAGGVRL